MIDLSALTKKNQEFIHIATNQLTKDGKSEEEIEVILDEVLPGILERQKAGETARHFLGAPTAWAASFSQPATPLSKADQPKNTSPLLMWADMALLFAGLVALINLIMGLIRKDIQPVRLLPFLSISLLGGVAMYLNYHLVYQHLGKPKGERPSVIKGGLIFMAIILVWSIIASATNLLPEVINPVLPNLVLAIIGVAAFGIRHWLQEKYNIQNAMQAGRAENK